MRTKADVLKRLHESDRLKQALAAARTPEEKKMLQEAVERFVGSFADVLLPMIDKAKQDPGFVQQLGQVLVERQDVVTTSDPTTSGSTG